MFPSLEISAALFRLRVFLAFPPEFCLLLMSCLFLHCPRSTEDNDLRGKETSEPSKLSSGHCDGEVLRRLNAAAAERIMQTFAEDDRRLVTVEESFPWEPSHRGWGAAYSETKKVRPRGVCLY